MCNCNKVLISEKYNIQGVFGHVLEETLSVVYDSRGYIRLGDLADMNCLDHEGKFKVNYCPLCGSKVD